MSRIKASKLLCSPASLPNPCLLLALCASSKIDKPKRIPSKYSFSRELCIIKPVETIPIRNGHFAINCWPDGEIILPSGSNQAFFCVCHRAQGMPNLSIISVCHCSHKVAGQKIITGFLFLCSLSLSKHKLSAAVPIDNVLPKPTSSAINRRTMP